MCKNKGDTFNKWEREMKMEFLVRYDIEILMTLFFYIFSHILFLYVCLVMYESSQEILRQNFYI